MGVMIIRRWAHGGHFRLLSMLVQANKKGVECDEVKIKRWLLAAILSWLGAIEIKRWLMAAIFSAHGSIMVMYED